MILRYPGNAWLVVWPRRPRLCPVIPSISGHLPGLLTVPSPYAPAVILCYVSDLSAEDGMTGTAASEGSQTKLGSEDLLPNRL